MIENNADTLVKGTACACGKCDAPLLGTCLCEHCARQITQALDAALAAGHALRLENARLRQQNIALHLQFALAMQPQKSDYVAIIAGGRNV